VSLQDLYQDALDHIAKVAGMARIQTDRLAFIEARAKTALSGERWNPRYVKYPKQSTKKHLVKQLLLVTDNRPEERQMVIGWLQAGVIPEPTLEEAEG
jgi:hypothetical protein